MQSDIIWTPEASQAQANDSYRFSRSFTNSITGAGGKDDLVSNTLFKGAMPLTRGVLESLYIDSWSAAKVVDLIVDDIFAPGVVWGEDSDDLTKMLDHLDAMNFWRNLSDAARAGRLFGTALLIACPSDTRQFETPLDLDKTNAGDIANLVVADRHSLSVDEVYDDPSVPNFGRPWMYKWTHLYSWSGGKRPDQNPQSDVGESMQPKLVHESRCFRFDGIAALNREGWLSGTSERWWGFSVLQRVLDELIQDMVMSAAGADVVQKTGMPVIQINKWREMLSRGASGPGTSPQQYANNISNNISRNKILFADSSDKFTQLQITASGVQDLLDNQVNRLAMIAGVPITRFTGESASGLNATGNGDAREWRTTVEAYRQKSIEPHMKKLMLLMARNAGLQEAPPWQWGRLGEMTVQEQVDALKGVSEALTKMVAGGMMDEYEAREILVKLMPQVNIDPQDFEPPEMDLGGVDKNEKVGYTGESNEDNG